MDSRLIFEKSKEGRHGYKHPELKVDKISLEGVIDREFLRTSHPDLPQVTENEVARHYTNLSSKNHHVDKDFYPLGSCTMKYNPKINEYIASMQEFLLAHPSQDESTIQGALEIIHRLERYLIDITGMSRATLQPVAGSQGEFVGLLIMRAYHKKKGSTKKSILIPETAHGTNPASVILAGFEVVQLKSDTRGRIDIDDLKEKISDDTAGLMLTQPNTLGLFEDQIEQISTLVHSVDGLMYMDGANLNALVGYVKPSDMGFDIVHINLHKTFSTPHGGGGPGAGPIAVVDKLVKFLPSPLINNDDGRFFQDYDMPDSIGRVHFCNGNFGILVRAYSYIRTLGRDGLLAMTKNAILNANYLKRKLEKKYLVPYSDGTMHEFVLSASNQKDRGVKALDIAKSLLDYGFHPPTIYFPMNVPEAMMIEPTESESLETLDRFADAMLEIDQEIDNDKEKILNAPYTTPVRRLDETGANRNLDIRWKDEV